MTKKPQAKPMKRKGWVVTAGTQAARPEACVYVNQAIGAEITYDYEARDWVGNCSISKNNWAIHRATPEATAIRLEQVVADYMLQTLKGMGNTKFACLQRRCKELEQEWLKQDRYIQTVVRNVEESRAEVARLRDALKEKERAQTAQKAPAPPHQYAPGSVCVLCGKPRNENKPTEASRQILTIRVVVDPVNP